MHFRPLPLMTVLAMAALAVLVWLGVWQLDRAEEKRAAIATYEARAAEGAHADLVTPVCLIRAGLYGQRVAAPLAYTGDPARFYGARDGAPGWRELRLTPAPDCAGTVAGGDGSRLSTRRYWIVETDFETLRGARLGPPAILEIADPPRAGAFTAENDPERDEFYRFDADALARAFGVAPDAVADDVWLVAASEGLPPGLADMPPSRHVGYALTWFGLALTLVAVYVGFHMRAGRLGGSHPGVGDDASTD